MGYYAVHHEGNIIIPTDQKEAVLADLAKTYEEHNNSEMAMWSVDIPTDLEQEVLARGFDFMYDSDEFVLNAFDSKWHTITEVFLHTILRHAIGDSAMSFRGEDGEMWRFTKDGVQNATIVWA
jgi:hypothetical protein